MKKLLASLSLVVFGACGSGGSTTIAVTGVTLNCTALELTLGDAAVTLVATISPSNASNKKVNWRVDQPSVVSITNRGMVTPNSEGIATVEVTTEDGGYAAKCSVKVSARQPYAVAGVSLDKGELILAVRGASGTLSATIFPSTAANKALTWSSSDSAIATVNDGVVTPLSVGDAVIAVTTQDGGFTAQCKVTVLSSIVAVAGVSLNRTKLRLAVGGKIATLTATVSPSTATNKKITWLSDNTSVAMVSNGTITPVAGGTATISVTTEDGAKSASCIVKVAPGSGWAMKTSPGDFSHVSVADLTIPKDFTLEVWVKPTAVSEDQFVIAKQIEKEEYNQFRLGFVSGNAYFMMTDSKGDGGLWEGVYKLLTPVKAGEWMHLAVTKSGADFVFYVDGVSKATFKANADLQHTGTCLLKFGAGVASDGASAVNGLDGVVDEIRIWDIARSADEIAADLNKHLFPDHPQYSQLIAYYQFDEGVGGAVSDAKGNHSGMLVNNPTWEESTAPAGGWGIENTPVLPVPTVEQAAWQRYELTAFFHFGMNTFTDKEWGDGTESSSWFNPTELDTAQWVKAIKDAGFRQAILVAKHHDGFCLWPSQYTSHSVKNSPWKEGQGDVIREFTDAAHEAGIKVGLYLSPWDRHESTFGTSAYNTYFKNQLAELLTNYGEIDEVWFDGANGEGPNGKKQVYDWNGFFALIRQLQPQALIAISGPDIRWVGNESGIAPLGETSVQYRGGKYVWYPSECDVSIRPGWFYHPNEDVSVKSVASLMDIYMKSVGRNCTLLLNIPPNTRGLIAEPDATRLNEFSQARAKNFSENLVLGMTVSVDSTQTAARLANDGNLATYWAAAGGKKSGRLEVDFGTSRSFNVVSVREFIELGERVTKYHIEVPDSGSWKTVAIGTIIGQRNFLSFSTQHAQKIALVIENAKDAPAIAELGVFYASDLASP